MTNLFWKFTYFFYPPILRLLEKAKVHSSRQNYLIGKLVDDSSLEKIKEKLLLEGFENAILSWKDPGEVLNMRRVTKGVYQYHLRIFNDLEIRGHYEFSSEGNPLGHIKEKVFVPEKDYFTSLLNDFLK
ncbi:hypothetical protein HOC13_01850 [Candidatus Woesearchaeota archaeon]|nr:hypothetical protein [Candidatus Woesearchaeota archaeon]